LPDVASKFNTWPEPELCLTIRVTDMNATFTFTEDGLLQTCSPNSLAASAGKNQSLQQHPCNADQVGWIITAGCTFPTLLFFGSASNPVELIWQHQAGECSLSYGPNPVVTRVF
jgi:hypothetical protein